MATGDLCQLADVKAWLNLTTTADDAVLARMITAQSRFFEAQVGRTIARATYTEVFDGGDDRVRQRPSVSVWAPAVLPDGSRGYAVNLRNWPVLLVSSVLIDGQLVPARPALTQGDPNNALATDGWVLVDGYRLELQGGTYEFTRGIANVTITYDAGWDSVPKDVEDAVIGLVAWRYRTRDRIGQVSKVVGGETLAFSRDAVPPEVQLVIDLYKTVRV